MAETKRTRRHTIVHFVFLVLRNHLGIEIDSFRASSVVDRSFNPRRMILVEHELPTLPEHPNSSLIFNVVRVAQSLVFCVLFYLDY